MTKWFSRYHPRFIRSIVYMLQATEYELIDYSRWLARVDSFLTVERRKKLVMTAKVRLLLDIGWLFLLAGYVTGLWLIWQRFWLLGTLFLINAPILTSYFIIPVVWLLKLLVEQPAELLALQRIKIRLRHHTALKIAIAGSFGKTTMREIIKTVLGSTKKVAAPSENINQPLGIDRFVRKLTGDEEVLIFELGEYKAGDIGHFAQAIQPDIGIITGVNEAHLEKFGSLKAATETIFGLADTLADKPVYVNGENETAISRASKNALPYTQSGVGEVSIRQPKTDLTGTTFEINIAGQTRTTHTNLLGLHQLGPLAVAADIAHQLGLSVSDIARGIEATKPFKHRLEPRIDSAVTTLDDSYNGNPDGVRAIITFLKSLPNHRLYVTPGLVEMGQASKEVHEEIGRELAEAGIEVVLLIQNSVTPFIAEGLKQANFRGELKWFATAEAAFAALPHLTKAGDVVVLQNDWPDQYA